jgi:hypothetical protein
MPQQDLGEDHDEALDQNGLVIPDLNLEQEEFFQPFDDHGNHGNALPDLNLQEEISIGSISVDRSSQSQENIIAAEHDDQENLNVDLVLALPAEPVNFMPLELQPHELNAMVSSDSESSNPLSAAWRGIVLVKLVLKVLLYSQMQLDRDQNEMRMLFKGYSNPSLKIWNRRVKWEIHLKPSRWAWCCFLTTLIMILDS